MSPQNERNESSKKKERDWLPRNQVYGNWDPNDEIVIAGMSGRFPESDNVEEFMKNLYEGVDMIIENDRRWPKGLCNLPGIATLKDASRFDATYFGVPPKLADVMDPQLRIILEVTYEALIDAGMNPSEVRGTNTGVYYGVGVGDSDTYWSSSEDRANGYAFIGSCKSMFANRISFQYDFTGPSFVLDAGCATSLVALNQAINDIRVCRVDSAIVCSSHLMLNPFYSQHLSKLGVLSPEMKSRVFDANATGFVRGEAAVALYLVRKSTARRSYASIVHVRNNTDGYKTAGVATPSGKKQYENNYALYKEAGVDPLQVGYIEAHGTGTKIGDPNELNSLTDLFCKKRSNSLLVGSLKSNMGHSECTAGLCSIVKVLLTMQTGLIPPNLNFKEPNPSVPSLFDGRVKVVEEVEILPSDYVGINAFSLGGSNSHVLMKRHEKVKNTVPSDELPRLVTVSGRTEAAVKYFLHKIDGMPQDDEFLALIHEIHKKNIQKHSYRGYTLVNSKHSTCEIAPCGEESRPVWFVCTGWGAQWLGRSKELMKFQVFERRIEVCSKVLEKEGINLYEIINNGTDLMVSEDFTKVFVTVGATQLALIDLLRSVGIKPDALVGISTGELTCAYIDGAVTAEQVMLVAYNTAQWIKESKLPAASMAVVCGLSYEEVKELCPPNIYVGVHNDAKTCTVVGPATEIPDFVNSLLKQGIVAKTVKSSAGVAFHTPLVIEESKILASTLQKIIPTSSTAKLHWISSSVTAENGRVPLVHSFNVDYFMNIVTGTVFTQEALMHIPDNAVVVEISPHSALQLTLSKVLPRSALRISLMSRDEPDQAEFLLTGLGKMYNAGIQMNLTNLYPKVSFPVSRGTPMIGPMIKWDHSAEWTIPSNWCNKKMNDDLPTKCTFQVDTTNDDSYLRGHVVNQQATYPHAGYLQLVWKAFAQVHKDWYENIPVKMENIELYETTLLPESGTLTFVVKFPHHYENSSKFELYESSRLLASGSISKLGDIREETLETFQVPNDTEQFNLTADDIYTDFRLRGVNYSGCFCSLKESDSRGTSALVEWKNNWVTFLDSLLQFAQIGAITSELYLPKRIQEIIINPNDHQKFLEAKPHEFQAQMNREVNSVKAGGVKLQGLEFYTVNKCKEEQNDPEIEKHIFIPYINKGSVQLGATVEEVRYNALTIIVQILQENTNIAVTKNILELAKELPEHELLSPSLIPVINKQPECTANIKVVSDIPEVLKQSSLLQSLNIKVEDASTLKNADCHLLIVTRPSIKELSKASDILGPGEFLMLKNKLNDYDIQMPGFTVIAIQDTLDCTYVLLRKEVKFSECMVVQMTNKNYRWVEDLQEAIRTSKYYFKKVVLISQGEYDCGLLGFSACLRREIGCEKVRSVFLQDPSAPAFSCTEPLYYEQLCKDLRINIYRDGVWGSQRHIRIDLQNNAMLPVEYAQAEVINQGDANTASWVESPLKFQRAGKDEEICRICYSSVGMKDTVYLNQSTQQKKSSMGCEFSGYNSSGAPVMGIVSAGALATHVMAHRTFLWPVPTNWNLEEASTVPHVYVMSFYALLVKGRILKDEWVLIHTSENTLGQAATRICLQTGCQVIATYRTAVELQNLKNVFGNMNNLHIVLSSAIEGRVLALTAGHGVNVVFNSVELSEQSLNVMRCLAEDGRFLDTALSDLNKRNLSCMKYLQNKTYHSIQLNSLFRPTNADKEEVSRLMLEGIKSGLVIPFSAKTFSESELEKALRYAADDGSSRKVVVKILEEMDDTIRINKNKLINAIPKLYINPEKVYVLAGGMGGFGIELAKWLVNHGAKKLVLTSRRGITVGYKSLQIRRWCDAGITVITSTQDITTEDGAASLILESRKLGSIGGIFILTMVLRDALFNNQTKHNFQEVCNAKVDVAKSLDTASQRLCPELDYFVAFSSIISGRGNVGQTTYGMANSAMERICEQRHALGLPALAIQWGPIGDVGVVFNTSGNDTVLAGTVPQIIGSCLSVFEHLLRLPHPVVTSYVLWDSKTEKKNCGLERNDIISAVANVLGIKDLSSMGSSTAPDDLGIDSMMTAEIRSTLEEQFSMKMSSQQVYNLMVTTLKEQGT